MERRLRRPGLRGGGWSIAALLGLILTGCSSSPRASASRVKDRSELVGGPRALGEVGDFVMRNGQIRLIIQDVGHSRGFGAFGGSLIDLDLERPNSGLSSASGQGKDGFSEMFPAFFLQAMEPTRVEVLRDGSDRGSAVVRASGPASDYLAMTTEAGKLLGLDMSTMDFTVDYVLEPGKRYLTVAVTFTNPPDRPARSFPPGFPVPLGFVVLLGDGQRVFMPGEPGFDLRFSLEREAAKSYALPALPGLVARYFATSGDGVSYGLAPKDRSPFILASRAQYGNAPGDSLLIPFVSGSFMGVFFSQPPAELKSGQSFSYAAQVLVGTGDVASVQEAFHSAKADSGSQRVAEEPVERVGGQVLEQGSLEPLPGVELSFFDGVGAAVSSAKTDEGGRWRAPLPRGSYEVVAVRSGRETSRGNTLVVGAGELRGSIIRMSRPAHLAVEVHDDSGRLIPAKVSVLGTYGPELSGRDPKTFLYDLRVGEPPRATDLVPDDAADPATREYLETVFFAPGGRAEQDLRAAEEGSSYRVVISRGPEYALAERTLTLRPGEPVLLRTVLSRVVDTGGYLSADLHAHAVHSIDSAMGLRERMASHAAEGVEYVAGTDHNYLTDYRSTVRELGLEDWVATTVGLELSTLELGHFNAFPLGYAVGPITHGSPDWFGRPAAELFAGLRALGKGGPERTVVQVNHPRDGVMGYFAAFRLDEGGSPTSRTGLGRPTGPIYEVGSFSDDFDALEVLTGKRADLLHTVKVPSPKPPPPDGSVCPLPAPGEILREDAAVPSQCNGPRPVAFPGVVEDWLHLLKRGKRCTATGNSDSHGAPEEAGYPRTYIRLSGPKPKSMAGLDEDQVVGGLKGQAALVSTGPFVELFVGEAEVPIGGHLRSLATEIAVRVRVQAAPWVDVRSVKVFEGENVAASFDVADDGSVPRFDQTFTVPLRARDASGGLADTFLWAEVHGDRSLWPVVTPLELPPLLISDVVKRVGGAIGLPGDPYSVLRPPQVQQVRPYALTNPVFIDRKPPGQALTAAPARIPASPKLPQRRADLLKLLQSLHGE